MVYGLFLSGSMAILGYFDGFEGNFDGFIGWFDGCLEDVD